MIELKNIKKDFQFSNKKQVVLNDLDFTIHQGDFIAIRGRSGSGKSTLLNIIAGLDKPNSGEYLFKGKQVNDYNFQQLSSFRKKYIGFIIQNSILVDNYTVFDNIALPLRYNKIHKKQDITKRVKELLSFVDLEGYEKKMPSMLSGGEAQRVSIARALINNPDIILADEPTGSLDEKSESIILDLLIKMNQLGKTIVIVTHDDIVSNVCKTSVTLFDGRLV